MKVEQVQAPAARIKKARLIYGRRLCFRNAVESDAEFILRLRTEGGNARFLSPTAVDIEAQRAWLTKYSADDTQAYFIIQIDGQPVGTIRLYDAQGESFCWGSWVLHAEAPQSAAIESALMVYAYGVDVLGFRSAHFDVRKGNRSVRKFHERFGAKQIKETDLDAVYSIGWREIQQSRVRYERYLPDGVRLLINSTAPRSSR